MTFTNVIFIKFILVNSMAKVSILNTLAEINKIKGKFREKKFTKPQYTRIYQ